MEQLKVPLCPLYTLKNGLNHHFGDKEPWQIVAVTTSSVLAGVWIYNFIFDDECVITRTKKAFFRLAKKIPAIKSRLDKEITKVREDFQEEVRSRTGHLDYLIALPDSGWSTESIISKVEGDLKLGNYDWRNGKVSGAVYVNNSDINQLVTEIYGRTAFTNPLHPDIFPGISKIEAEVIKMVGKLLHGGPEVCGSMTNGGTESILMACKAYRDYAREVKGIKNPEIVVPVSIHSAFDKASQYFGFRVKSIPLDPVTYKVDIKAMKRAISRNTIMLAGSAPNYPYGTIDDLAAISELGLKYNIPVHVDSCLGGFLTMFMPDAGCPVPICDFRLEGVTSISADTHKYGYAPKGTSVVLYRDIKYIHHQYTVTTDWPGGVYGSPTMCGSRAGGNIAVCWATMLKMGMEGYVTATRNVIHTARYIEKRLIFINIF
nr:sphingosine-1-phosphate lyase-like [Onthophagus taurus]